MSVLAGILLVVAWNMAELHAFTGEFRGPKSDVLVMLTTLALTVLIDLSVAIQAGMVLAAFLFMRRMAEVTNIGVLARDFADELPGAEPRPGPEVPKDIYANEINGPFFFGAAEKFRDTMSTISGKPFGLVLGMHHVPAMDSTGLAALRDLVRRSRREGTHVALVGLHAQPMIVLAGSGFLEEIGDENMFGTLEEALKALERRRTA